MKKDDKYRIVVGHDLEAAGDQALAEAIAMARRVPGAELHVAHVVAPSRRKNVVASERRLDDALVELRARVDTAPPDVTAHAHVRIGDVTETLVQIAVDYDASLILVGTHGRRGLDRVRHRSVAERLVRTAPLSVLVAHPKSFAGIEPTPQPDAPRPGEDLHDGRVLDDVVISPGRGGHISGLV